VGISKNYKICVLPGDGIGPEVIEETIRVLKALDLPLEFSYGQIGYGAYQKHGAALPKQTEDLFKSSDAALFGAVTTPPNIPDYSSPVLKLRRDFDLYVNLRPIFNDKLNFFIVRENTEGLYSGIERVEDDGNRAISERVITRKGSERIIRYAFDLAQKKNLNKVTVVHKANVLRATCGLFRKVAYEIAEEFPNIDMEDLIVDTCAMELIRRPEDFQVIVTTNLFGDILSDEAAMLMGGLGMAYSGNIGEDHAMFEPVHGSAPNFAGTDQANPMATMLAAKLMLENLGLEQQAIKIGGAIKTARTKSMVTPDLGGELKT
jgi:isopropylmalate/isohomocitrate dehydrogenase-like protein